MKAKTIIEGLRNYFMDCPILDKDSPILIDFNNKEPLAYSVNTLPGDPKSRNYIDGRGGLREYNFALDVVNEYNTNVFNQLDNLGFYEHLSEWINEQQRGMDKNLPILPDGKESIRLINLTGGYLYSSADSTAIYRVQLKLVYLEDK